MGKEAEEAVFQWHPAFFAGIQIEFSEEKEKLIFENEHQLGTKPKQIFTRRKRITAGRKRGNLHYLWRLFSDAVNFNFGIIENGKLLAAIFNRRLANCGRSE